MTDCSSLCSSSRKPGKIHCAPLVLSIPFFDITCFVIPSSFSFFLYSWSKELVILLIYACVMFDTKNVFDNLIFYFPFLISLFVLCMSAFFYLSLSLSLTLFFLSHLCVSAPLFICSVPFYPCESLFLSPFSHPCSPSFSTHLPPPPHPPGLGTMQLSVAFSITPQPSPDESQVIGVVNLFTQRQFTAH